MATLLITGVAGFVGTNLARHLLSNGHDVIGIDVNDRLGRLETNSILHNEHFTFIRANLARDANFRLEYDGEIAGVLHLAALPHVDYSYHYPREVFTNNVDSLLHIIPELTRRGVPLIFASSVECYGGTVDKFYTEHDALSPLSPYAASKVACEAIIRSWVETQGLRATTLRFTNLYGPWQAPDRLIPRVVTQILFGYQPVVEAGTNRDFMFINDACDALEKTLKLEHNGEVYNLSTGIETDNAMAAQLIEKQLSHSKILYTERRRKDGRGRFLIAQGDKLQSAIHWSPKTSLADGVAATAIWYEANKGWLTQFDRNVKAGRSMPHFLTDTGWLESLQK